MYVHENACVFHGFLSMITSILCMWRLYFVVLDSIEYQYNIIYIAIDRTHVPT